jgi:hypothetical protein
MTIKQTTYVLDLVNGDQRRITVPSKFKVTFGPTVPYIKGSTNHERGYALRFYEGNKENQRAIFTDVIAFRDSAIPIEEKVTRTKQQTLRKQHGREGFKDVVVEARVTEWRNPDAPAEPDQEFLAIEGNKVSF